MTQANRTLVTLAVLLAIGGGVGLYAWYGVFEHDKKEDEKKDKNDRLFMPTSAAEKKADGGIVESEFVKLTVVAKGDTTVLERVPGGNWQLVSPVQAPADKIALDALVSQLQQSKFKHLIEEKPDAAAVTKYGLDKPDFTIEAVAEVGAGKEKRTVKLEAGIENTYDGSIYMRRNGGPAIHSAEGGVKWTFGKSTFELREKDVLGIEEGKVRSVTVKGRNNEYTLTADEKRNWKITARRWAGMKAGGAEATFDGDPVAINGALGGLRNEKATSFPTDTPEARAAFDAPAVEAHFVLDGDAGVRVRLFQPAADAGEHARVLVERAGTSALAEIPGSSVGQLDRLPTDFRDKRLMPFKKEEVARIHFFTNTGVEVVAEKASPDAGTADSWRIVSPKAGPAKTLKIASLLWTLGAMKQLKLVEEAAKDVSKYGLESRARAVSIYDAAGRPLGHLEWGKDVPGGNPGNAFMRGTRGDVVEGEVGRLADFPKAPEDLIDAPPGDAGTSDAGN